MKEKMSLRKIWVEVTEVMTKRPIVLLPFFAIAFLEALALEFLCFSTRKPLSFIADPIINKFFGEQFLYYPYNMFLLPKLFYYKQVGIYIIFGVFLSAIAVNIYKNIQESLPLRDKAIIKNQLNRYFSYFCFAVLTIILIFFVKEGITFVFAKAARFAARFYPNFVSKVAPLSLLFLIFLSNIIVQALLVFTIPIIVIKKKSLLKALLESAGIGLRNFFKVFLMILLPYLIYLPVVLLKSYSNVLAAKTVPEINVLIISLGIILTAFLDCFIICCATQYLMYKEK